MHGTAEIIEEATSLPVEERLKVVESLLHTLNPHNDAVDALWKKESIRRLEALRSGAMPSYDGAAVLAEIRAKYGK